MLGNFDNIFFGPLSVSITICNNKNYFHLVKERFAKIYQPLEKPVSVKSPLLPFFLPLLFYICTTYNNGAFSLLYSFFSPSFLFFLLALYPITWSTPESSISYCQGAFRDVVFIRRIWLLSSGFTRDSRKSIAKRTSASLAQLWKHTQIMINITSHARAQGCECIR